MKKPSKVLEELSDLYEFTKMLKRFRFVETGRPVHSRGTGKSHGLPPATEEEKRRHVREAS
jgi:hypothetical protein